MSCKLLRALLPAVVGLFSASCSHQAAPGARRLAIHAAENLSGDAALDGAARTFSLLVRHQLTGLPDLHPLAVDTPSDVIRQRATGELRAYLTGRGGRLDVRVFERDPQGRTVRILTASADSLAPLAGNIARQIAAKAIPPVSAAPAAIEAFSAGAALGSTPEAAHYYRRAAEVSPDFGEAWLALGNSLFAAGDRTQAAAAWAAGLDPRRRIDEITRARIRVQAAASLQSPEFRDAAEALARLLPADSEMASRAGLLAVTQRDFAKAEEFYGLALKAEPGRAELWNQLAYAQAYAGNFPAALKSVASYNNFDKSANAADSRGEVLFLSGRFKDAAQEFRRAYDRDATFLDGRTLRKAAEAYRRAGDRPSAEREMQAYLDGPAAGSADANVARAQWEYRTGRRDAALRRLSPLAPAHPAAAAQLIVWLVEKGDRDQARSLLPKVAGPAATLLTFLAQAPADPTTWSQRTGQFFPDPRLAGLARVALGYALLLDHHPREAAATLKEILAQASPLESNQLRAVWRRALKEGGLPRDPSPLHPLPSLGGSDAIFDSLALD